jgi:nuclear control of ATPase protein 2
VTPRAPMTSAFIEHHTRDLEARIDDAKLSFEVHASAEQDSEVRLRFLTKLRSLLFSLKSSRSSIRLQECLQEFALLEQEEPPYVAQAHHDSEELVLKRCIRDILALRLYSESLEIFLNQAIDAEAEAEWWANVERSCVNLSMYLLQSKPPQDRLKYG